MAYAPYNESGDIFMNTDNWDILWFETKSVISTKTLSWPYTLLENTKTLKDSLLRIWIWYLVYIPSFDWMSDIINSFF